MTNRQTSHEGKTQAEKPKVPDFSKYNVHDSYCNPITDTASSGSAGTEKRRVSHRQLEEIDALLGERDREALLAIQRHRYLLTGQVQRLVFTDAATGTAALRAASRCLKKLRGMGLIDAFSRRIGGVRAGSGSFVWHLSHAGERLLRLREHKPSPIRHLFEPSPYFLAHTLAVAEASIQLMELCREEGMALTVLQPEPECWRPYSEHGVHLSLKPDLYAVTISGEYEDRWFLEIDLSTESPAKVIEKCQKYHRYYRSGLEQEESGIFPLVVWIVPDKARKESLIGRIRESFEGQPRLFAVITGDELAQLIQYGGDRGMLC